MPITKNDGFAEIKERILTVTDYIEKRGYSGYKDLVKTFFPESRNWDSRMWIKFYNVKDLKSRNPDDHEVIQIVEILEGLKLKLENYE